MLLEGSDCGGNGLSIVGAVSGGIGEELSGEAGLFRMFGTKIGMLLVSCGLELVQSLSEHCLHLGHVGLVDLLKSLEASAKSSVLRGLSVDADAPVGGMPAGLLVEGQRRHWLQREQPRGAVLTAVQNQQNQQWQVLAAAVRQAWPGH